MPFDQVGVAGVAPHRRAALVVPPDVQHGGEPRAPLHAVRGAPPAQPLVRAVPRRPRRRRARAPARPHAVRCSRGARAAAASDLGDVARVPRAHRPSSTPPARNRGGTRRIAEALDALRPGDVVVVRRYGGRLVVLEPRAPAQRRQPRSSALSPNAAGRAARTRRLRHPAAPGGDDRAAGPVRAAQPGVPAAGRRAPAPGEAPRRRPALAPRRPRGSPSSRNELAEHPAAPRSRSSTREAARPRRRSSGSNAT